MITLPRDLTVNPYTQTEWDLNNSRVFDIALIADNKHVAGFLDFVAYQYRMDNPTARKLSDKKYWLKRIVINLIASAVEHKPVAISMSKADYGKTVAGNRKDRYIYKGRRDTPAVKVVHGFGDGACFVADLGRGVGTEYQEEVNS